MRCTVVYSLFCLFGDFFFLAILQGFPHLSVLWFMSCCEACLCLWTQPQAWLHPKLSRYCSCVQEAPAGFFWHLFLPVVCCCRYVDTDFIVPSSNLFPYTCIPHVLCVCRDVPESRVCQYCWSGARTTDVGFRERCILDSLTGWWASLR